ncbi:unnamed protein product, partial [Brenthis ino]
MQLVPLRAYEVQRTAFPRRRQRRSRRVSVAARGARLGTRKECVQGGAPRGTGAPAAAAAIGAPRPPPTAPRAPPHSATPHHCPAPPPHPRHFLQPPSALLPQQKRELFIKSC